jgi:PAS domain S-box-containing protein
MMAVENQKIVFETSRLSDMIREESARVQRQQMLLVTVLFGTVLVLFIAITFFGIKRIIRGFSSLENGTAAIGSGNLDFRIDLTGDDEFHSLATSFNAMAANMKSAEEELQCRNERTLAAYEQLATAQQQYRDLFENVSIGILRSTPGPEGKLIEANPATLRIFEADSREQLFAVRPIDLYADPVQRREISEEILAKGSIRSKEVQYRTLKGNIIWGHLSSVLKTTPDGASYFDNTLEDITLRKQAEEALRESEERYRIMLDQAADAILMHDGTGRILDTNRKACENLGYSRKELLSLSVADLDPEAIEAGKNDLWARVIAGEQFTFESHQKRKDGSTFPVEVTLGSVLLPQGPAVLGIIRDITERKQAEHALKDLNLYNRTLIEVSIDPLVTISPEGKIQDVNVATETATGLTRQDLIGTDFSEYFTEPKKAREGYLRVLSEGKVIDYPLEIRHRDGHVLPVLYNATLYRDGSGDVRGVFAAARDISERKRSEEQRENLIRELAQKNDELDRFTYTVSHDLKSPLTSIRGFIGLLEKDLRKGDLARVEHDVRRVSESAEKLERLITSLLTLSRSGRSVDTPAAIPFSDLSREAVQLLESTLQERGITVVIPDNLPVMYGDHQRLLSVMTNLVGNAAKFMGNQEHPRVELSVRDDPAAPVFCVQDNGMGIAKENLESVFMIFRRFNPEIPGTGIGLATVKRIIEAHGGKIWAESDGEGRGTTVCFTLPRAVETTDNNNTA